ncbi:hypothetical protein M8818_005159 [Zalaria obscura]|uniref:Uncharacterized protein n=1 Tax=Zalaria obscura TaxID=2024903 RepID=A0ACC3S9L0_9PEZI
MSYTTQQEFVTKPCLYLDFQILSDLHLELASQHEDYDFGVSAPYLILAGDIGRLINHDAYLSFLRRQSARYDHVYLVLGNHEFYGSSYREGLARAESLTNDPSLNGKVTLLHRQSADVHHPRQPSAPPVTILGCTLWSHIPETDAEIVRGKVKDYKNIDGWTVAEHNRAHSEDLTWLRETLARAKGADYSADIAGSGRRTIVVTHHAPIKAGASSPRHADNSWTSAFATDLPELLCSEAAALVRHIHWWIFGHTHYSTEFIQNGIRVVSNQRGYVLPGGEDHRQKQDAFNAERVIRVRLNPE